MADGDPKASPARTADPFTNHDRPGLTNPAKEPGRGPL